MVNKLHKKQVISPDDVKLTPKPEKRAETDSSHDRRYFQPQERCALIEAAKSAKSPRLYPTIIVSLNTGVRPQSLFSLIWSDVDWNSAFSKLVQAAGLDPKITWYNMRHDFASQLLMAGVSLYTVKELMCHKNITTTQVYAHLAPDLKTAAVKLLEKL
ncbi:tyrosine-type recombinase/integrase [Cloacibacillus sp. An23]|uniref:tyrosine-type recombinase/integrase n=1 Tax=Cloacibacillus sp. An23 TaxID=1965591 RepID=UPI00130232ED|nr:tyrosine-type recombinase/integrase [Cloacibacillus sp. An23]